MEANLAKGSLLVQYKLIKLYVQNIGTLGTNAALIAAMTLIGLIETIYPVEGEIPDGFFSYVYYILCLLAWIYSLLTYSESAVNVIWGPVMALSGGTSDEVMIAIKKMKQQQNNIFRLGSYSGLCLLLGMMVFTFALQGVIVGSICAVVYVVSIYLIFVEGNRVMQEFDADKLRTENPDEQEQELDEKISKFAHQITNKITGQTDLNNEVKKEKQYMAIIDAKREELNHVRGRGVVWMKPENINCFEQIHLVARKGHLEFYKTEQDFLDGSSSMMSSAIELNKYTVETDIRKINSQRHNRYSATASVREMLLGSNELSYMNSLYADFDTTIALQNFKFSLIPKLLTEIENVEAVHFMAEDLQNYSEWLKILKRMTSISDEIGLVEKAFERIRFGADDSTRKTGMARNLVERATTVEKSI